MKNRDGTPLTRAVLLLAILVAGLSLGACASKPMAPPDSLNQARNAIARAEQSDGRQYAGSELDMAKEKLEMAETAVDEQDMAEAERLAQEALIAAELALARTSAAKAEEVNREMERGGEALTDEMRRKGEEQQ